VEEVQGGGDGDDNKAKFYGSTSCVFHESIHACSRHHQKRIKPSFTEALHAFSMRTFMHAHDITERDQANIVNIESLLFNLKWKGATKQMKINDFLKKNAKWT
jgi:hypothetical protein